MKWITIKFKTREITSAQLVFTWNLFQILPIREVQGSDKCDAATIYNNLNTFLYKTYVIKSTYTHVHLLISLRKFKYSSNTRM
jgi:hypothetical protein